VKKAAFLLVTLLACCGLAASQTPVKGTGAAVKSPGAQMKQKARVDCSKAREEQSQIVISGSWESSDLMKIQTALAEAGYHVSDEVVVAVDDWRTQLEADVRWLIVLDSKVQQISDMSGLRIATVKSKIALSKRDAISSMATPYVFNCVTKDGGLDDESAINKALLRASEKIAEYIKTRFP
jgi:hypothetical protein